MSIYLLLPVCAYIYRVWLIWNCHFMARLYDYYFKDKMPPIFTIYQQWQFQWNTKIFVLFTTQPIFFYFYCLSLFIFISSMPECIYLILYWQKCYHYLFHDKIEFFHLSATMLYFFSSSLKYVFPIQIYFMLRMREKRKNFRFQTSKNVWINFYILCIFRSYFISKINGKLLNTVYAHFRLCILDDDEDMNGNVIF